MAQVVSGTDFSSRQNKYDWTKLLDGQEWKCDESDFGTSFKFFGHQARLAAKRKGLGVRVKVNTKDQTVTVQAYELESNGEKPEPAPKKKSSKK